MLPRLRTTALVSSVIRIWPSGLTVRMEKREGNWVIVWNKNQYFFFKILGESVPHSFIHSKKKKSHFTHVKQVWKIWQVYSEHKAPLMPRQKFSQGGSLMWLCRTLQSVHATYWALSYLLNRDFRSIRCNNTEQKMKRKRQHCIHVSYCYSYYYCAATAAATTTTESNWIGSH